MMYAPVDMDRRASDQGQAVHPVANKGREPYGQSRLQVRPIQEANINAVLTKELFHFQLPAANISIPASQPQGFPPGCPRPCNHA
jgi:hypothetical protein